MEGEDEEDQVSAPMQIPVSSSTPEQRSRHFRQVTMPSLLNQTTSSNSNNEEISVGEHVSTCEFFSGHHDKDKIRFEDSDLKETGFMNPDKRKSSLISVLVVLQWVKPFMTLVSRGASEILTSLQKVRGCFAIMWNIQIIVFLANSPEPSLTRKMARPDRSGLRK